MIQVASNMNHWKKITVVWFLNRTMNHRWITSITTLPFDELCDSMAGELRTKLGQVMHDPALKRPRKYNIMFSTHSFWLLSTLLWSSSSWLSYLSLIRFFWYSSNYLKMVIFFTCLWPGNCKFQRMVFSSFQTLMWLATIRYILSS